MKQEKPAKHDLFNAILKQGLTCMVDFTPRHPGVIIPEYLHTQQSVQFKFDSIRCRDIVADEKGVCAGMTFSGRHYTIYVPWTAAYCISFDVDGSPRGIIYQDDIPASVVDQMVLKSAFAQQAEVIRKSEERAAPKQASLQGGAKIYDLAEARARKLAREQGGPRRPAG